MSTLIGVHKGYTHGMGQRHWRAKQYLYAHFINDNGKYCKKRVSKLQAFILGFQVHKRITVHCARCGAKFHKLVKKRKHQVECPNCGELG